MIDRVKMPGCSALGCSNRTEQGFLMKYFPRDPARRKQWIVNMKREQWTATNKSVLCEVHFESSMWEKTREDGSRKLKLSAVPTIFPCTKDKRKRKPSKEKISIPMQNISVVLDSSVDSPFSRINPVEPLPDPNTSITELNNSTSTNNLESSGSTSITLSEDAHYEDLKQLVIRLQNQNKILKLRNRDLENNSRKLKYQLLVFSSKLKMLLKKRK